MSDAEVVETTAAEIATIDPDELAEDVARRLADRLPAPRPLSALQAEDEMSVQALTERVRKVEQIASEVMTEGIDYGRIEGIQKPTLFKPGAETLCLTFKLDPRFRTEKTWHGDGHLSVEAWCTLVHIPTGLSMATDVEGFCTSREERYAYRYAMRICPVCGKENIRLSKQEAGSYYCWKKTGGCGATFHAGSPQAAEIAGQAEGKVPNENLPDTYNTIVKMAAKRALVAAVLIGTAASRVFTQDVEDTKAAASPEEESSAPTHEGAVRSVTAMLVGAVEQGKIRDGGRTLDLDAALAHVARKGNIQAEPKTDAETDGLPDYVSATLMKLPADRLDGLRRWLASL
jgi:hypothetical protein